MSEAEIENVNIEAPGTGLLRREFEATIVRGDGRTVDVQIVPYGEQITHNDGLGGVPKGVAYKEEWAFGSFSHQLTAANRVLANAEHEEGIRGVVGHGLVLREEKDGLFGSFRIHETPAGDTTLILINEGVYNTVSLEAVPRKAVRTAAGVIQRVKADLRAVAFSRFGAYKGARVLAVRDEADIVIDEDLLPVNPDPELIERCRRLGIVIPQRYEAHPEDPDTPADAGTSDESAPAGTDNPDSKEQT